MEFILVGIGGMAGAISRFLIGKLAASKAFPFPTIIVNLIGSLLIGISVGKGIHGNQYLLAATGFLGAFTTFSTLNVDLLNLIYLKRKKAAIGYSLFSYMGGLLCVALGLLFGKLL